MGWGNNNPRNPNAPCPTNNPHCQGEVPSVNIDYPVFIYMLIAFGIILAFIVIYRYQLKNINHE